LIEERCAYSTRFQLNNYEHGRRPPRSEAIAYARKNVRRVKPMEGWTMKRTKPASASSLTVETPTEEETKIVARWLD